jgi:hypothetical protein
MLNFLGLQKCGNALNWQNEILEKRKKSQRLHLAGWQYLLFL